MYGDIPLAVEYGQVAMEPYIRAATELRQGSEGVGEGLPKEAARRELSRKYLGIMWDVLSGKVGGNSFLLANLRSLWRALEPEDSAQLVSEIERWHEPLWKFGSVGHLNAWLTPVAPLVTQQHFTVPIEVDNQNKDVTLYLTVGDAGDGNEGDFLVWRRPRLEGKPIPVHGDPPRPNDQPPILLRDLPLVRATLEATIQREFAGTEEYLSAAARLVATSGQSLEAVAAQEGLDADRLQRWCRYLGIGQLSSPAGNHLAEKMSSVQKTPDLNGWRASDAEQPQQPFQEAVFLVANSGDRSREISAPVPPGAVVVQPSRRQFIGVGWRAPDSLMVRLEAVVEDSHTACGNGVAWMLQLQRPGLRRILAWGEVHNQKSAIQPQSRVSLNEGDMLSLLVEPLNFNNRCDLTRVDLTIYEMAGGQRRWNLSQDVSGSVLEGNPHTDAFGNPDVWHFFTGDAEAIRQLRPTAPGSALARWFDSLGDPSLKHQQRAAARALAKLLESGPPPATSDHPDALAYRDLTALDGPLLKDIDLVAAGAETGGERMQAPQGSGSASGITGVRFGDHPGGEPLDGASFVLQAPAVLEVPIPARLAGTRDFVVDVELDAQVGQAGSVQAHVSLSERPMDGLVPPVGANDDHPEANAHPEPAKFPVIVRTDRRKKGFEDAFSAFREWFPPALCYTQIVPVDEGITLTLFHREDDALSRLMLEEEEEKKELDRLWHELRYISQDAIKVYDSFDGFWNSGAHYQKFSQESRERPIRQQAERMSAELQTSQPRHIDALLDFAERAYRRPLAVDEKIELLGLYRSLRSQDQSHDAALRAVVARVLVSPNFLYRIEEPAPGSRLAGPTGLQLGIG